MLGQRLLRALLVVASAAGAVAVAQAAPAPGGHDVILARLIRDAAGGQVQYQMMTPELAQAVRGQAAIAQSQFSALGALKSVTFQRADATGMEFYRTDFERGALEWAFAINGQGLITNANYRPPRAEPR